MTDRKESGHKFQVIIIACTTKQPQSHFESTSSIDKFEES